MNQPSDQALQPLVAFGLPFCQAWLVASGLGIAAALLAFVAGGVWCLVRGGIVHGMTDVANYNRERADEQWERDNPQVGRVCGIIMLAATALGLLLLFGGMAASDAGNSALSTACAYFWVVWPIGGIACGIATLAMKAAADGRG